MKIFVVVNGIYSSSNQQLGLEVLKSYSLITQLNICLVDLFSVMSNGTSCLHGCKHLNMPLHCGFTHVRITLWFKYLFKMKIIVAFHIINMKSDYLTPVYRCIWVVAEFPVKTFHILILHFWTKEFLYCCIKLAIINCICIVTKCKNIVIKFQELYHLFQLLFLFATLFHYFSL